MTGMYQYLRKVNPELGKRYQMERYASGTTGKGHDCPNPRDLALGALTGVSTGA